MQALAKIQDGGTCETCQIPVCEEALKCNKCSLLCHLGCSGFPEYQLVRFAITRCSYLCRGCLTLEEADYKKGADIVKRLLAAEAAVIGAMASENEDPVNNDQTADGQTVESTGSVPIQTGSNPQEFQNRNAESSEEVNNGPSADARRKKTICKFYRTRTCKYGTLGERCLFDHPKKCLKYITHGSKTSRGCKKGKECSFYHPPLCWSSVNNGTCHKTDCKFQHIRGTVVQRLNIDIDQSNWESHHTNTARSRNVSTQNVNERSYSNVVRSNRDHQIPPPERDGGNVSHQNFLELRDQIQQMQGMMRKMMVEKDHRGIGTTMECHRCHESRH